MIGQPGSRAHADPVGSRDHSWLHKAARASPLAYPVRMVGLGVSSPQKASAYQQKSKRLMKLKRRQAHSDIKGVYSIYDTFKKKKPRHRGNIKKMTKKQQTHSRGLPPRHGGAQLRPLQSWHSMLVVRGEEHRAKALAASCSRGHPHPWCVSFPHDCPPCLITFLCLHFLICRMGALTSLTSQGSGQDSVRECILITGWPRVQPTIGILQLLVLPISSLLHQSPTDLNRGSAPV